MARKAVDLTDRKFKRLTVIRRSDRKGNGAYWFCQCDCGNVCEILSGHLTSGNTKSCGCLNAEQRKKSLLKHGDCRGKGKVARLYVTWCGMKARCLNPKSKNFHRYGGRGITICREWKNDYISFKKWAMDNGYAQGLQIDRTENNSGYFPDNCRWVTHIKNCENSTVSKLTAGDVAEIRRVFTRNPNTNRHFMAILYDVVDSTISHIINNKTWQNI